MIRRCWVALLLLAVATEVAAQVGYRARYYRIEEPQLLKLQIDSAELGMDVEGDFEDTTLQSGGPSTTYERFFIAPALGLTAQGSIYHPNLIQFQMAGDVAYGWSEETTKTGSSEQHHNEWQVFGDYRAGADIFATKPLHGSIYSNYGRSFREFDFFTHVTVESLGYGARIAYSNPRLVLGTTYAHTDEEVTDTSVPYSTHQDLVSFDAHDNRPRGSTTFNYTFNQYNRSGEGDTSDHTVSLSDSEQFGSRSQFGLGAGVTASHRDTGGAPEDQYSASVGLGIEHTATLTSDYSFGYDRFETTGLNSDTYSGRFSAHHQLYESLYSSVNGYADSSDTSADLVSGFSREYGGGITEAYTKRLGQNHRLRIDGSFYLIHIDQKSTGRAFNERHSFPVPPAIESFFLNLPNAIESTIVVSDPVTLLPYVRDLDYQVLQSGAQTEIRRIIGGSIPEGATVRVDYEALPTPEASYNTYTESAGIRLELWNNLLGVYGRWSHNGNDAPSDLFTTESTRYVAGSDLTWHWLRAGAEYEHYNSNDSIYWSARLYQTGTFVLDQMSSLNVGLSEAYTEYLDTDRREQDYRLTSSYYRTLSANLSGNVRAGVGLRRGEEVDQTLALIHPELNWQLGQTMIQFIYDFEYNMNLGTEERFKHTLMMRLRRRF